ncbi:MAG: nucleotidyl transferase AbiEii/AbiGii toxin family protein [Clostridia bacterium]|nr:nucleotidyl transferase AbiEii/AbiGii toxin family protein [Clostridia bacterium]
MYEVANESVLNRQALFLNTAQTKKMNPAIVEKDFWVCYLLELIFHKSSYIDAISFKGGTSLSKGYKCIQRFSEDIDLILDWRLLGYELNEPLEERTNTKQDVFKREMDQRLATYLQVTLLPHLDALVRQYLTKDFNFYIEESDLETIRFVYPQIFKDKSVLQEIRLEIGPLAAWTPFVTKIITPYAAEEYPQVFRHTGSEIRTVEAKRTFWEKATILHREANRTNGKLPDRYSRHYYDLFMLAQSEVKNDAFNDLDLLAKVVWFKDKFYRSLWAKYNEATPKGLRLIPPSEVIDNLKKDYEKMQEMIFGERVSFDEITAGLKALENEIHHL